MSVVRTFIKTGLRLGEGPVWIQAGETEVDLLPYWFYLAGSLCFAIGTAIVILRGYDLI